MKTAALLFLLLQSLQSGDTWTWEKRTERISECATLEACLDIPEALLYAQSGAIDEEFIDWLRAFLKERYGDAAKYALIERARTGSDKWRSFAGYLLWDWGDWREEDIPLIREVLRRDPRNGAARGLGDIGTPAAIDILIENLPYAGRFSYTGLMLRDMGPTILGRLLPAFEIEPNYDAQIIDDRHIGWLAASDFVKSLGADAQFIADEWIAVAHDRRQSKKRRIAALRAIGSLNGYLGGKSIEFRSLRNNRDEEIADAALRALIEVRDAATARVVAQHCKPSNDRWEHYPDSFWCLQKFSEFGANGAIAGDLVLPFLQSENALEQAIGIETLGLIGYTQAIPEIEPFLTSKDWRHVYASVRALGQLDARQSVGAIESATREHWLPDLWRFSNATVAKLLLRQPYGGRNATDNFGDYNAIFSGRLCKREAWTLDDQAIVFQGRDDRLYTSLNFEDGALIARDVGEFGGGLDWQRSGDTNLVTLVPDNTSKVFSIENGALAIHGLSHMGFEFGYATLLRRNDSGAWTVEIIAQFPGAPFDAMRLEGDTFVVKSAGHAVVFTPEGIIGVADCDWNASVKAG